ncbi:MAG: hypothetical protein WC900_08765 [Oscillospiraceae bacterium]|jgi:hypothetical protein
MKIFNGKELDITLGSFQEADNLFKAVCRALKGNKIDLPDSLKSDLSTGQLSGILDMLLSVISDDEIESCIFECAKRCGIGPTHEKINIEYFEKEENRQEYIPVMLEIAKANLFPFMTGITSSLGAPDIQKIMSTLQKSK